MRIYFVDCGPAECAYILLIVGRRNAHIFCRLWAGGMRRWFDNSNDPTEAAPAHPVQFAKPYFQDVLFSVYTCSNFGLTGGPGREQFFQGFVVRYTWPQLCRYNIFIHVQFWIASSTHTTCSFDVWKRYLRKSRISASLFLMGSGTFGIFPFDPNAFWHLGSRHITLRRIDHPELFVLVEEIIRRPVGLRRVRSC